MGIDLASFEKHAREATRFFWVSREEASTKQKNSGVEDAGERSAVTAGKNMDGFAKLVTEVITANGIDSSYIFTSGKVVSLPGYFRPIKAWDLLVVFEGKLLAAIEFKSQIGPSFGNNFNNRVEEAIGNATDLWTAYRDGAFLTHHRPFLGYLMFLEDCNKSMEPVRKKATYFSIMPEFEHTSYAARYDLFCKKLVEERLYSAACLVMSSRKSGINGEYSGISVSTSLRGFVTALAGHIAAAAAM